MGYSYMYEEDLIRIVLSALAGTAPSGLLGIAGYVLSSLAIYSIAKRRGLNHPWMAWVPVLNCWLLGSLSDQYRYVVKGENKSKRKVLLILSILMSVFTVALVVTAIIMVVGVVGEVGHSYYGYGYNEQRILSEILGPVLSILGLSLPLAGVAIAYAVIRYMALYDVYRSLDPANSVMYLVLSIVFQITEPFFLFFNRNKDEGMPPRKGQPEPAQPYQEPINPYWEENNKDYL